MGQRMCVTRDVGDQSRSVARTALFTGYEPDVILPRIPAKEKGVLRQNLVVGKVKAKANLIPDDLHLQSPARRPVVR